MPENKSADKKNAKKSAPKKKQRKGKTMPGPTRKKRLKRHPTKSRNLGSARGPPLKAKPLLGFLIALLFFIASLAEFYANGMTEWFYAGLAFSLLIFLPNALWATQKYTNPFAIPYLLTMVRTKRFVKTIKSLGSLGKVWEKVCIAGLFLGFGLAGVDYWFGRKIGGWRRAAILLLSAIALFFVLWGTSLLLFPRLPPLFQSLIPISVVSFLLLGFGGLSLGFLLGYGALSVNALFTGQNICPTIAPVIPGVPIPGFGVAIPFIAWVSLGIILVVHEGSHGIMMVHFKTKLKSVGLLLAGLFPVGAFVEQDDKEFSKMPDKKRNLILSAGPAFNLLTVPIALLVLIIFVSLAGPAFNPHTEMLYGGYKVNDVKETIGYCGIQSDSPLHGKILEGDTIKSINGKDISKIGNINSEIGLEGVRSITVLRNGKEIKAEAEPVYFDQLGIFLSGLSLERIKTDYEPPFWYGPGLYVSVAIKNILSFLWILSFAVGMINFLPSDPLDGGRIAKSVLRPYFGFMGLKKKETEKLIGRVFAWLFLLALLLNLIPYIMLFL